MINFAFATAALLVLGSPSSRPEPSTPGECTLSTPGYGVLVMAHGGTASWNAEVEAAVEPLRRCYPVTIAFGMADPASLQEAARQLEAAGAHRIAVVRLFISGQSWLGRTEQILGLRPGAPPRPVTETSDNEEVSHGGHGGMALWRIESAAEFRISRQGLAEAGTMGTVLAERARGLSTEPAREEVLILAHGPGDDAEDALWREWLEARAATVRVSAPFHAVRVMTLREDWPEKRAVAVAEIRRLVEEATLDGYRTLVIPYRIQGFGPYAAVLEGLAYRADHQGLLPHPEVTRWIAEQVRTLWPEREASAP